MAGGKNPPDGPREPGDGPDSDFPGYGVSFHVDVQYGHGGDDASSGDRPSGPRSGGKLKTTAPFAILGVAYSASIGGMGTLVGSPPNAIAAHELGMGFAEWFRIAMPIVLVFGVIVFFLMYLFLRPNLGMHVDMVPEEREGTEGRLNARQVRVLILFVLVAGSWMCSSFLSSALGGIPSMDTLIALSAAVLLPLCGVINWSGIAKIRTGASCFCSGAASRSAASSSRRGRRDSWQTRYLLSPWGTAPSSSCSSSASSSRR